MSFYAIALKTTEFEFSHGRKPRGRGGWIFEATPAVAGVKDPETVMVEFRGTYAECARAAKMWARDTFGATPGLLGITINTCP
jgi:hypothetical protein